MCPGGWVGVLVEVVAANCQPCSLVMSFGASPSVLCITERAGGHRHDHQDQEEHPLEGLAHGGWMLGWVGSRWMKWEAYGAMRM